MYSSGNNVAAFVYRQSKVQIADETSGGLVFDMSYNDSLDPRVASNIEAATVNAFYIANTVHDFTYRYGFTEKAFNFQGNNFGKGGKDNDFVLMSVQDGRGVNNANFATPPEYVYTLLNYSWEYANAPL